MMIATNSTADGGGCCGNEDGAGANSNKDADCSIAGKEVLVPPLKRQENTQEGPSLHSIVPRKSCWCPHDTSLNHFDTVLGLARIRRSSNLLWSIQNEWTRILPSWEKMCILLCKVCGEWSKRQATTMERMNFDQPGENQLWLVSGWLKPTKSRRSAHLLYVMHASLCSVQLQHKRAATMKEK